VSRSIRRVSEGVIIRTKNNFPLFLQQHPILQTSPDLREREREVAGSKWCGLDVHLGHMAVGD